MSDDYNDRFARAESELEMSGLNSLNYAPPLFRLARKTGLRVRPPHYMSFLRATLILTVIFGTVWGVFMWIVLWRDMGMPWQGAVAASALAGILFGLLMAEYYRWSAKRAGLSRWEDL